MAIFKDAVNHTLLNTKLYSNKNKAKYETGVQRCIKSDLDDFVVIFLELYNS